MVLRGEMMAVAEALDTLPHVPGPALGSRALVLGGPQCNDRSPLRPCFPLPLQQGVLQCPRGLINHGQGSPKMGSQRMNNPGAPLTLLPTERIPLHHCPSGMFQKEGLRRCGCSFWAGACIPRRTISKLDFNHFL